MEYYFNNNEYIFNGLLKNSLRKYFLLLLKNDEWINCYNSLQNELPKLGTDVVENDKKQDF